MALSKAEYEKAIGRTLSDAEYAKLTAVRAPAANDDGTARAVPVGNANDSGAPMFAEAKKAAKGAKPVAPPTGTGTVEFMANTRQGVREIKENITSPADLDKYVTAGIITPDEAAAYKAQKWPAPAAPKPKGDPKPLQTLVKTGPGVMPPNDDQILLDGAPKVMGPATPLFQAATSPKPIVGQPSQYASGMSNEPAPGGLARFQGAVGDAAERAYEALTPDPTPEHEDEYSAVIGDARKKWGL